jgi:hypothetical protein
MLLLLWHMQPGTVILRTTRILAVFERHAHLPPFSLSLSNTIKTQQEKNKKGEKRTYHAR